MSEETAAPPESGTGHAQPTDVADSTPNSGGPERAAGGMGISSERVGHTGGGTHATDGERDTTEPAHGDRAGNLIGSDAEFEQGDEDNPEGLEPKSDHPSTDPRHDG
jgi:hypothetical protein